MASRSRFWVGVLVPGVCVTLVVPGSLVFHARAAENSPIAMHPKAVTLELVCRDGAGKRKVPSKPCSSAFGRHLGSRFSQRGGR